MSRRRIIIHVHDGVSELQAAMRVASVIGDGRVSTLNKRPCYCLCTVFHSARVVVYAHVLPSGTDVFHVVKQQA